MNYPTNFMPQPISNMGGGNNNYGINNNPYYYNTQPSSNNAPMSTYATGSIPQINNNSSLNFCGINGKFVESKDIVGITEIPGGGYGVFPRADLQEIYIKTWNKNGLTDITTYVPKVEERSQLEPTNIQVYGALEEHIKRLESKLDSIVASFQIPQIKEESEQMQQNSPKKEINF